MSTAKSSENYNQSGNIISPYIINYVMVHNYPHDTTSFTEGLLVYNGDLYESTGSPDELPQTKSIVGIVDLKTGKISNKIELDRYKYFGEGITVLDNKIYQLTYQSKIGFIYDLRTFKKIGKFFFPNKEGWGLTTDGHFLIMSDGTDVLTYIDPHTFKIIKTIRATENNISITNINELEFIDGYIYANIYTTDYIIKIDTLSGNIVGKMDLNSLATEAKLTYKGSLEMNGIAYDSISKRVYITGKFWPSIYEINFSH